MPLELKSKAILEGFISGIHHSPYYGHSVEFKEHRPYIAGDDIKYIDWKLYGKKDRVYIKRFESESNTRCYFVLDLSSSMNYKYFAPLTKLQYSIDGLATMLHLLHRQRDACALCTFSNQVIDYIEPSSTVSHIKMLFKRLESYYNKTEIPKKDYKETALAGLLNIIANRVRKRSFIIIFSDFFETIGHQKDVLDGLQHLRFCGHEVLAFRSLEWRSEIDLLFNFPKAEIMDLEQDKHFTLKIGEVRKKYRLLARRDISLFKEHCARRRIDVELLDTEKNLYSALMAYLIKRSHIR